MSVVNTSFCAVKLVKRVNKVENNQYLVSFRFSWGNGILCLCVSKASIVNFTRRIARTLATDNILAYAVHPGLLGLAWGWRRFGCIKMRFKPKSLRKNRTAYGPSYIHSISTVAIAQLENRSRGNSRTKPKPITDRVENIPASTAAFRWVIDGSGTYPVLTLFFLHIFVS